MNKKEIFISGICIIFSLIMGILSNDIVIGGLILLTGLLNGYFAGEGKRINYILGFINYVLMAYVSFKNHLYGMTIFYTCIFAPLQIKGFLEWNKTLDEEKNVIVREFTLKNSIIITISCVLGSFILAYLLNLIPNQQLSWLDASSNCINLCGIILMILRFKEAWWVWLTNNIIDLVIWIILTIHGGEGAIMMLVVSIGYFLLNIYGIVKWNKKAKESDY